MSNTTAPCMSRFTTAKGEHWCSIQVARAVSGGPVAHDGPCVELTERWGAVENTIWAAMRSNAHLLRPATEGQVPAALCTHGIDAMRRCSICREDAHAEAIELDRTREIQRWTSDTHPGAPTDWAAVLEYATKRAVFTEDEWARIAQIAADGNAVAKASIVTNEEPTIDQVWECQDQVGRTGEQVCVTGIDTGDEDTAVTFIVSKAAKGYEAELGSGGSMEAGEFAQRYRYLPGVTAVKWWS